MVCRDMRPAFGSDRFTVPPQPDLRRAPPGPPGAEPMRLKWRLPHPIRRVFGLRAIAVITSAAPFGGSSLRPRSRGHDCLRVLGQPVVLMAAYLGEEGEIVRGDLKACERPDRDRARELRYAGSVARVHPGRLFDEALCRQKVDVAGPPRSLVERVAGDREVIMRQDRTTCCVHHQDAALVDRQSVAIAVDDRVEHRPDRVAGGKDGLLLAEWGEVDGFSGLEGLDVRIAGSVKGDFLAVSESAQELPWLDI